MTKEHNFGKHIHSVGIIWCTWFSVEGTDNLPDRFSSLSNFPTFAYSYIPSNALLTGYTNDLGLAVAYAYEPHRDVKTLVSNAWGTNVISTFAYDYDPLGRRTQRIDDATTTNLFGYNPRSELTSAEMGTNTYTYAYASIGNRTSSSKNGTTNLYAANELNQYTALNPNTTNNTAFAYDADGNMTSDDRFVYAWNGEDRMVMASNDEVVVTYAYDNQGRMVHKEIGREGVEERNISYIWDNWNIVRETLATNNNPLLTHNVWGLDLDGTLQGAGGVGGLLAVVRDDGTYLPTYDANGNISEYLETSDGAITAHSDYSPFGEPVFFSGGCDAFTHWFSTKPWCIVTGLAEYQYRHYRPEIGRWMSRDPIGERNGLNNYAVCVNGTINTFDHLGLWDIQGVLEILCCKSDAIGRNAVKIMAQYKVFSIEPQTGKKQFYEDAGKQKKVGAPVSWKRGGYHRRNQREIAIDQTLSNEEAAGIIIHETTHAQQHDRMSQNPDIPPMSRKDKEREARIVTEQWRLDRGFPPEEPSFRIRDPKTGQEKLDIDAINKKVDSLYGISASGDDLYFEEFDVRPKNPLKTVVGPWICP